MKDKYMFKKIYVEITNACNLKCPFCLKTKRNIHSLSFDEFKDILSKIKPYTKYLYLHVLGEPLVHSDINKFIDYAAKDFNINITSNGYLINNINTSNIRQINISLHSFSNKYNKTLDEYLNDIFEYADKYSDNTYINYRLWIDNEYFDDIITKLNIKYNAKTDTTLSNTKLDNNIYLNFSKKFDWPEDNLSDKSNYIGECYALNDHIAILSDGTVTACCLDGNGVLSFGNIFYSSLEDILNSKEFINMKYELKNGIRNNPLCKKCNFLFRD